MQQVNFIVVTPQDVHNGKKKLSLLFLLVLLPLVSAVQIDSGTIIQSVGLNTTLNFTSTFYVDVIQVESNSIYLEKFRTTSAVGEYITMNITNEDMTGFNAPYISSTSSTSKTITSQLSQAINATVVVNVNQCSFKATYEGSNIQEDSCADGQATFTLTDIPTGESFLELSYLDLNCSSNTGASIAIILIFSALAIVAITFIIVMKFKEGELDVKILIIVFIALIVGLVLFTQIAQLTGSVCN